MSQVNVLPSEIISILASPRFLEADGCLGVLSLVLCL